MIFNFSSKITMLISKLSKHAGSYQHAPPHPSLDKDLDGTPAGLAVSRTPFRLQHTTAWSRGAGRTADVPPAYLYMVLSSVCPGEADIL